MPELNAFDSRADVRELKSTEIEAVSGGFLPLFLGLCVGAMIGHCGYNAADNSQERAK